MAQTHPTHSTSSPKTDIPARGNFLEPLKNPVFLLVWTGAFVSNIGNWMENAAQNWAVVHATQDNPRWSAFLAEVLQFADFIPVLFLALLAGVITDRVNRKIWLIQLQIAACVLASALAVAAFLGYATPWVVIFFTFLEGIVWAFNGPVWLSVAPMIVPRALLHRALALNAVQFNMARLIGPVLAGIIIAFFSIPVAFAINAASFALVIFALTRLPKQHAPSKKDRSMSHDLRDGLRYVFTHPGIRRLTLMGSVFMFLAAPMQGLLAIFAQQVLHGDSALFGFMLGSIGLGSVIGAFVLSHLPSYYPRHHLIPLSMCLFAATAVAYSFSTHAALSLLLLVVSGMFWMMALNPTNTANQLLATEENRGRVMSVMLLANQGSLPLGHLAAGFLTHVLTPQWIVRSMAALLLVIMIGWLFMREPAIDALPRRGHRKLSIWEQIWEAITAHSHRPQYPAEIAVDSKETEN